MRRLTSFLLFTTLIGSVNAAPITVTNNSDSGAGSLRQAIIEANASPGADKIVFSNDFVIKPLSLLPTITETLKINATGHTVKLDGSVYLANNNITCPCQDLGDRAHPALLFQSANNSAVMGMTILNWCNGITIVDSNDGHWKNNYFKLNLGNAQLDFLRANNHVVHDNVFYQDPTLLKGACSGDNVELQFSSSNHFHDNKFTGGENAYELLFGSNDNVIENEKIEKCFRGSIELNRGDSGNKILNNTIKDSVLHPTALFRVISNGIHMVSGSNHNIIKGNKIMNLAAANGIAIQRSSGIGGNDSNIIKENTIINVPEAGILVNGGRLNTLEKNIIQSAGTIGIDLSDALFLGVLGIGDGVTPNNSSVQANDGQNYPVMNEADSKWNNNLILLKGTLQGNSNALPNSKYKVECYGNASAVREARVFLGDKMVVTDVNKLANITLPIPTKHSVLNSSTIYVSCTATSKEGNTSELSDPIKLTRKK